MTVDVSKDVTVDVSKDVTGDVSKDVAVDVSKDVAVDVSNDVTVDVSKDVTVDVSIDATADVSKDVTVDVSIDVTVDVSIDGTVDIPINVTVDVSIGGTVFVSKTRWTCGGGTGCFDYPRAVRCPRGVSACCFKCPRGARCPQAVPVFFVLKIHEGSVTTKGTVCRFEDPRGPVPTRGPLVASKTYEGHEGCRFCCFEYPRVVRCPQSVPVGALRDPRQASYEGHCVLCRRPTRVWCPRECDPLALSETHEGVHGCRFEDPRGVWCPRGVLVVAAMTQWVTHEELGPHDPRGSGARGMPVVVSEIHEGYGAHERFIFVASKTREGSGAHEGYCLSLRTSTLGAT